MFEYCEQYLIAFEDATYGQLLIFPAPVNSLAILVAIPSLVNETLSRKCSEGLTYLNFWVENLMLFVVYILFEVCLVPLAYIKVIYHIYSATGDFLILSLYVVVWLIVGPVV